MRRLPRLVQFRLAEPAAVIMISMIAFAAAAGIRAAGWLERIDLALHDRLVRAHFSPGKDDRFVLVLEDESDLGRWGFPLPDEVLATLIQTLLDANVVAIGIDKYRDRPVEPGAAKLAALLGSSDRVYWVEKFGTAPREGVAAPASLPRDFVGCADMIDDVDGNLRRALLYLDAGERFCYSLPMQLARHAARRMQLAASFTPDDPPRLRFGHMSVAPIDPGDGPYARADTSGFQVAFPAAAGLAAMPTVPMSELLAGRVPAEQLRDRLVLFGSAAESLRDFFNVPSPSAPEGFVKVAGVQAHAAIASYLLRAAAGELPHIRLASAAFSYQLAALLALAAAAVATSRKGIAIVVSGAIALIVVYSAGVWSAAAGGLYVGPAVGFLAIALALPAGIAFRAWRESRERDELMVIFSRHVSPQIADELWQRRMELIAHGEVLPRAIEATVFFLDIRSFTTVTEALPPERAVRWLNRGLAKMTEILMAYNGVVTRFSGDAIMAAFGAPLPRTLESQLAADAQDAIDSAITIGSALDTLNAEFSAEGLPPIRVRVGINTGIMTQCSVGTARRMEFTLLGDAVNIAARLESYPLDDDGRTVRLLIGARTMALAGNHYQTRLVGTVSLKGKGEPVTAYQVLLPT